MFNRSERSIFAIFITALFAKTSGIPASRAALAGQKDELCTIEPHFSVVSANFTTVGWAPPTITRFLTITWAVSTLLAFPSALGDLAVQRFSGGLAVQLPEQRICRKPAAKLLMREPAPRALLAGNFVEGTCRAGYLRNELRLLLRYAAL
jgi:hypothetical protein